MEFLIRKKLFLNTVSSPPCRILYKVYLQGNYICQKINIFCIYIKVNNSFLSYRFHVCATNNWANFRICSGLCLPESLHRSKSAPDYRYKRSAMVGSLVAWLDPSRDHDGNVFHTPGNVPKGTSQVKQIGQERNSFECK